MRKRLCMEELVKEVAANEGLTQKTVRQVLKGVLEVLKQTMAKDKGVFLAGFGVFRVVERGARKGRNPKTGEEVTIPARKTVVFKPAKDLTLMIRK